MYLVLVGGLPGDAVRNHCYKIDVDLDSHVHDGTSEGW